MDGHGPWGDTEAAIAFFDQLPIRAMVLDDQLRYRAGNGLVRRFYGAQLEVGLPIGDLLGELGHQGYLEVQQQILDTGEAVVLLEQRVDAMGDDGTPVTLWVDLAFHPRRDESSRVVGVLATAADATERREARLRREAELTAMTARFERSRQAVTGLQRALLPHRVPALPGLELSAAYVLGDEDQAAGGDWFDVVVRDEGPVVLVVGDVVGHGMAASAAMGQLRAVLLDHLEAGRSIADAVAALDRRAVRHPEADATTLCLVELDLDTGQCRYVTAGHPPPLVVDAAAPEADGTRFLAPSGADPLGSGRAVAVATAELRPEEVLVLYTDGATERPGRALAQGTVELAIAAHRAVRGVLFPLDADDPAVDRATTHVIRHLERFSGHADDTTILAARRRTRIDDLALTVPADAQAATTCREAVRRWLAPTLVGEGARTSLDHVVTELVQNVVDHAYADQRAGVVRVRGHLHRCGEVEVAVADDGGWIDVAPTGDRGRGLALVRGIARRVHVERSATGTTVTTTLPLHRPAGLFQGTSTGVTEHPGAFDVFSDPADREPRVHAVGPLDQRAADALTAELAVGLSRAQRILTLDLTSVTLLASSCVRVLLSTRRQAAAAGIELELVAPVGSPADQTLAIVGLRPATRSED